MPAVSMLHEVDPAKDLIKRIGDLSKFELFGNQILLGVYERPSKMKPIRTVTGEMVSLELPDQTRAEDQHQGKAALVLRKGPSAFLSDSNYDFRGQDVKVGDWVAIFVSDGRRVVINKVLCRLVEDYHIRMKIPAPDAVF